MFTSFSHILQLIYIGWVLARHDAFFFLKGTKSYHILSLIAKRNKSINPGERLSKALESLGPVFIKLGQALSMRPDLLDDDMIEALTKLQDKLAPFDGDKAISIIEKSLNRPLNSLFSEFNKEAVAAASIAQVHKATNPDGKIVAVKVLRPNVREQFAKDIKLFYWLAKNIEKHSPKARRLKPTQIVKTLEQSVQMELDLRYEAASCEELHENAAKHSNPLYIPQIYWSRTSDEVLSLEWIDGIAINQIDELKKENYDLQELVKQATQGFFMMAFEGGVFHADMHAGNVIVRPDNSLALVDFGICGRLALQERMYIAEIFHGFLSRDYTKVAKAHIHAGYVPANTNIAEFALAARAIVQPILGRPLVEISGGALLAQLFRITETFQMETQPQLLLLQKSLILVEGIGRTLAPESDLWQLAEPPIKAWAEKNLTPKAHAKLAVENISDRLRRLLALQDKLE